MEIFKRNVTNWAVCDSMTPRIFAKHTGELLPIIKKWLQSAHPYTVRFGLRMLMCFYLEKEFASEINALAASVCSEEYYVNMMQAWYFATALAKQYDSTVPFVEERRLSPWVHNKTIQKAVESFRITAEQKAHLKTLRLNLRRRGAKNEPVLTSKSDSNESKRIEVVAAIIEKNGKILICRRAENKTRALKWEFPGGKLESGETYLEHIPFDLYEMFDEIAVLNGQSLQRKNITLTFEHCENLHNKLIGSPLHVKRILMNIIGNAIKYGKNGGYVKVSVSESGFDEKIPDTVVINITCKDNGIGMGENFMKVMFEPFMQENDHARTFYQGTGLGLAIAKRLTENMNGKIDCVSRKNIGTCFTVSLPFETDNSCECTDRSKVTVGEISLEGLTILLAEDNRLNMEITEFLLTNEGATVIKAWNGKEALELFEQAEPGTFDIILMDLMMPVMSGLETAKNIRALQRPDAKTIPIIAMTANAFSDDVADCKAAGMNEHVSKPLDADKLIETIAKYVSG